MVKSVLSVTHRGLRDWVIQRLSAIILAISFLALFGYFLFHPHLSFFEWKSLFATTWVKILAILCLLSLIFHAWIGIWTIVTDYINCYIIRLSVNVLVFLMLFASFVWGLLILWSV